MKKNHVIAGLTSGFLNGLFGSGGGIVAVLFLRSIMGDEKKAHANGTFVMLIMSLVSLCLYAFYGHVDFSTGLTFVPGGLVGAVLGAFLLKKIKPKPMKKLFGLIMIVSGLVMIFM